MRKKIIIAILALIFIIIGVYVYTSISNRDDFGNFSSIHDEAQTTEVNNENKLSLLNIKIEAHSGKVGISEKDIAIKGNNFDEAIDNGSFVKEDEKGKIKVQILDESYEEVEKFYVSAGDKISKWIFLSGEKKYYINYVSEELVGAYKVDCYKYKIY